MNTVAYSFRCRLPRAVWILMILLFSLWGMLGDLYAQNRQIEISTNINGTSSYRITDSFSTIDLQYSGEFWINDDETDIVRGSRNAYLKFSKKTFGQTRTIQIEADSKGELTKKYLEGSKAVAYEPEGRRWLADVLPEILRMTGIAAEQRVASIFKEKGASGVLNEISQMGSNSVKGAYFDALFKQSPLTVSDMEKITKEISYISSNSEKGRLLRDYRQQLLQISQNQAAYFRAVETLSSNTEKGSVLDEVMRAGQLDDAARIALLQTAITLSSNTEKGHVLRKFQQIWSPSPQVVSQYFEVVNTLSSNTEKGAVLQDLLRGNLRLNEGQYAEFFRSVNTLSSNTEKGAVLRAAIRNGKWDQAGFESFFNAVETISSSTEKGAVLQDLAQKDNLTSTQKVRYFRAAISIPSNTEKGAVLRAGEGMLKGNDAAVLDAYFSAVSTISSSTEAGGILTRLLRSNPSKEVVIRAIQASKIITSNTEKGSVLTSVESRWWSDAEVKAAIKEAARTLSSDTEYRRVMEKMD